MINQVYQSKILDCQLKILGSIEDPDLEYHVTCTKHMLGGISPSIQDSQLILHIFQSKILEYQLKKTWDYQPKFVNLRMTVEKLGWSIAKNPRFSIVFKIFQSKVWFSIENLGISAIFLEFRFILQNACQNQAIHTCIMILHKIHGCFGNANEWCGIHSSNSNPVSHWVTYY